MKKIIIILVAMVQLQQSVAAQDSVQVSISWQARDAEYSGGFMSMLPEFETLYDTVKLRFRVATPPTGTTAIQVTGYIVDFVELYKRLVNDATAQQVNVTSRLKTLLLAVNQPYLTAQIAAVDALMVDAFSNGRQYGRFRLRRRNN